MMQPLSVNRAALEMALILVCSPRSIIGHVPRLASMKSGICLLQPRLLEDIPYQTCIGDLVA